MDAWMALLHELAVENTTKILLLVCDGLGDAPFQGGKTAMEAAQKPNLDTLARKSALGLADPVGPGITPGSGPGHLALFGYDPLTYRVGRGVLSALGVGLELQPGDVAARGNFATADPATGFITDRRAGRIPTELCIRLCERLQSAVPSIEDVEVIVRPEKEHRFVLVLRGECLEPDVTDTDPQREGVPPREPQARSPQSERTARILRAWIERAREVLRSEAPANMVLLRGLDRRPEIPPFPELYRLRAV
ncbi:MAG: phosphoglycerate mutase, partial [Acidobacteria bacterium]|nr:phosphoglycerate mutase [Acidobacteriota bacterium]MDW7985505.1 phosphoglycerate mutase [Acidobacteriota bacterium]